MGVIRRVIQWILAIYTLTVASIVAFSALAPTGTAAGASDIIVVLGAGLSGDGTLHQSSKRRVDRGVTVWTRGLAPRLHFTGGVARPDGVSAGQMMAERAMSQGVPEAVISYEGKSQSTLQNALFSQPMLEQAARLRLVTEGFHLPRSWVTFRWASTRAGGPPQILLTHSDRFRPATKESPLSGLRMVLREGAAVWFNLVRAIVYDLAGLLGTPAQTRAEWLA